MSKQEEIKESVLGFINLIMALPVVGNEAEIFTDDLHAQGWLCSSKATDRGNG